MTILQHSRFKIFSKSQHPLNHSLSEFLYSNPAYPDIRNVEDAMDAIFSVLYPQAKGVFETYAELPAAGNNSGDFYTITNDSDAPNPSWKNDGDHSQGVWTAGYIWHKYDGDVTEVWHKQVVYDWAADDVVSELINRTSSSYVHKKGLDDVDENGDTIIPPVVDPHEDDYSGQSIWGGATAGTNLTLSANNGDVVGNSGYIQLADDTRPTRDLAFDFGTALNRIRNAFMGTVAIGEGPLTITSTTGVGGKATFDSILKDIDFVDNVIRTTARVQAGELVVDDITIDDNQITSAHVDGINFTDNDLTTSGTVDAGRVDTLFFTVDTTTIDNGVLTDTDDEFTLDVLDVHAQENVHAVRYYAGGSGLVGGTGTSQYQQNYSVLTHPLTNNFSTFNGNLSVLRFAFKLAPVTDAYLTDFTAPMDLNNVPLTGNVTATVVNDSAGSPNMASVVGVSTNSISAVDFANGFYLDDTFTFDNLLLPSGTIYWLVLSAADSTDVDAAQRYRYSYSSTNPVDGPNDDQKHSNNSGASFINNSHEAYYYWNWIINGTPDQVISGEAIYDKSSIVTDADTYTIDPVLQLQVSSDLVVSGDINGGVATLNEANIDFINIDGQTIKATSTLSDPNLVLDSDSLISFLKTLAPVGTDIDIGVDGAPFRDFYMEGSLGDSAANRMSMGDLLTFKDMFPNGIANGHVLFWNSTTNRWEASAPDTEIDHRDLLAASLTNAGKTMDAGHDQFAMLNGRVGGQFITGGTTNTEKLTMRAYVGSDYLTLSNGQIEPSTANFSVGTVNFPFGDMQGTGQLFRLRFESRTDFPVVAALNVTRGRFVWRTDAAFKGLWVDDGIEYVRVGSRSFDNQVFTDLTILGAHDVSPVVAASAIWQVKQVSTGEVIGVTITVSNTNEVTVSSDIPLDTGVSYSLVGVEA